MEIKNNQEQNKVTDIIRSFNTKLDFNIKNNTKFNQEQKKNNNSFSNLNNEKKRKKGARTKEFDNKKLC